MTVTKGNDAAQALYERCGFAAFGVEPFAIAQGGTFIAQQVFTAAGPWSHSVGDEGIRCKTTGTNTFFVENSAGNVTGGVYGRAL